MNSQEYCPPDEKAKQIIGLRTAVTILEGWKASNNQVQQVLRISGSTLDRVKAGNASARLDVDQLERISIVLNIHAIMRTLFENPENVYGFMSRPNDNDFFNGRAPLDVIAQGCMQELVETYCRLEGLRHGNC